MLEDFISSKKSLFAAGVHTELRVQENRQRRVSLVQGNLTSNVRSEISGISARVYKNGVYGFSSTAELNGGSAEAVLAAATENAAFMDKHINKGKAPFPALSKGVMPAKKQIVDTEQKQYVDFIKEIDNYIVTKYPNLASRSIVVSEDSMEKILCTSDGYDGHTTSPRSYIYVFLNSETTSGMPIELFVPQGGFGNFLDNFDDPKKLYAKIDALYEKLMHKREGVYAEAGYKTVVLDGKLAGMLAHEAVGHTVEADLVLGGSVAGPNLNKHIASDFITLVYF